MATPKRRKAKKATAKKRKRGSKAGAKPKRMAAKARGKKPARRAKAAPAALVKRPKAKSAKSRPKSSARRHAPGQRHLLTSTRRPKAPAPRGPSRARAVPRRHRKTRLAAVKGPPAVAAVATIRDFAVADAAAVNAVALAAFEQYRGHYEDWPAFASFVGAMANLAEQGELIVAELDGRIAGAVAYFGPRAAKPALFDPDWPVIRMLVVDPAARGAGLGRLLIEECISRARRDGAVALALHTSPIMQVALAMYLRRGFVLLRDSASIFGVPYRIYLKRL